MEKSIASPSLKYNLITGKKSNKKFKSSSNLPCHACFGIATLIYFLGASLDIFDSRSKCCDEYIVKKMLRFHQNNNFILILTCLMTQKKILIHLITSSFIIQINSNQINSKFKILGFIIVGPRGRGIFCSYLSGKQHSSLQALE